jgi:hypothetical protein
VCVCVCVRGGGYQVMTVYFSNGTGLGVLHNAEHKINIHIFSDSLSLLKNWNN